MGLSSNSPVVLTVVTAGASYSRSFSIKVNQAELVLVLNENLILELLSSPRAKRAGPKGLRAESARAFTGGREINRHAEG